MMLKNQGPNSLMVQADQPVNQSTKLEFRFSQAARPQSE